ncbi:Helicase associated domain protein [Streptomyces sp. NBC_01433]|uniref:DEAD/DEAH box helicase n=1 Tax=Streptomyces sp. NBC_01433 TaxID=2903864 RepID=UPI0022505234|nr:DEAD/DEAH box helicase [Streptomyces sp. NBC_01433]MCX4681480.1 Helicase associated domain protein [Streptomyces sp. NBC_01433]
MNPSIITPPPLWPHQREAVAAATAELAIASRATVVMACGTGKTRVESEVADAVSPTAPVLVVLPTLDLIAQTLRSWVQTSGRAALGTVIAVCSDDEIADREAAADLSSLNAQVTTDPERLSALLAERKNSRCTVAITYQSLPILAAVHREQAVDAWRLVVVDEAHRSAGARDRTWSIVHDDVLVPASKRLYLTATPRIVLARGKSQPAEIFSMDDEKTFGRVAYRLSFAEARKRGLLADYRVVVAFVTDKEIRKLATAGDGTAQFFGVGRAAVSAPMLARQIAVLRAAREFGIQRLLTYHHRVRDAEWFAKTLPAVDTLLNPANEAPTGLITGCVHGGQNGAERRAVLEGLRAEGTHRVIISNARVLAEGYDAPAVDGVAFISPRDSPIDTIQAVGRALRLGGQRKKTACVVIPVLLEPGQDPVSALEGSSYGPVWRVIQALAAHDEMLATSLKASRTALGHTDSGPREVPGWLAFSGAPVPPTFASAITAYAVRSATESWDEFFGALKQHRKEVGHLQVPTDHVTPSGLHLGRWLSEQRSLHKRGRLAPERCRRLEEFGVVWDLREAAWQRYLHAAREYHRAHGHLRVPADYCTDDEVPVNLGGFLLRVRVQDQQVSEDQRAELNKLGIVWASSNDHFWDRMYAAATAYRAEHGDLNVPTSHVTNDDPPLQLGKWLTRCRAWRKAGDVSTLTSQRALDLDGLGMVWDARTQKWNSCLSAAEAYFKQNGDLAVPTAYETEGSEPMKLGLWIQKQRKNRKAGILSAQQIEALTRIGMIWAVRTRRRGTAVVTDPGVITSTTV